MEKRMATPHAPGKSLHLRIADFGSVGVVPDAENWGSDYSHNLRHLEKVITPDPPYIDKEAFVMVEKEFKAYVDLLAGNGINGLIVPFLLEFVNFDLVEDGEAIYGAQSNYRKRHLALRKAFRKLFTYASSKGVEIFLYSDMVILTPPLEAYLLNKLGSLDTSRQAFWEVYKKGLEELFTAFPEVKGAYIRIGEAGTIYNMKGWDYRSELQVKTGPAVRSMLRAFLEVAEKYDKLIVFRTWSVGVGNIGDMHTNPETYDQILSAIDSRNLLVSTKYCNGDYYSFMPLNRTLFQGKHKRLIEFQARREFEAFNAIPLFMGPLYQKALQSFFAVNDNIEGIWLWTQYGGPLRAGPLSLYPFHGFNLVTDLNVYATARLARNPEADIVQITDDWIKEQFGSDPELVKQLRLLLLSSFEVMKKGLYISEFARKEVKALGLLPPPMLWIFEWDIVTAGNSVLGYIYSISGENVDAMVAEGQEAVDGAREMKKRALGVKHRVEKNHKDFVKLVEALDYEINLFEALAGYRRFFMHYYQWIETGDSRAYQMWRDGLLDFLSKEAEHTRLYGGNLDFPAYNFSEAKIGANLANNAILSRNMAIGLLVLIILLALFGLRNNSGARTLVLSLFLPVFPDKKDRYSQTSVAVPVLMVIIAIVLGTQCLTGFAAPVTSVSVYGLLLTYLLLLFILFGTESPAALLSVLSPVILLFTIYLAISSTRGPGRIWYLFWTNEPVRMLLLILSGVLLIWTYVLLFVTGRKIFARTRTDVFSIIFIIQGFQLALLGVVTRVAGLEASLTAVNDELAVLPGGLSRILGITTHLNIPTEIPIYLLSFGIGLVSAGMVMKRLAVRNPPA